MFSLSKNEEMILLSIWRLKEAAYGVPIRRLVARITGKTLNYGSLYTSLDLLSRKGLVTSNRSEPRPEKGGRSKIIYLLTADGKQALKLAHEVQQAAWEGFNEVTFEEE